jgi:hypothetical protein
MSSDAWWALVPFLASDPHPFLLFYLLATNQILWPAYLCNNAAWFLVSACRRIWLGRRLAALLCKFRDFSKENMV